MASSETDENTECNTLLRVMFTDIKIATWWRNSWYDAAERDLRFYNDVMESLRGVTIGF